jgi:alkylation response protein AidB-like acyl-CoA dehydrogenase
MTDSLVLTRNELDPASDLRRSKLAADQIIATLDELAPALEAESEGNERLGLLSDRTVELLREAGIPLMTVPEELGGLGLYPGDCLRISIRLAEIDGPIGWIGGNWSTTGATLGYLDESVAKRILDDGFPLVGMSGAPTAKATAVDGGYRVTGRWQYGSGDLQAHYVFAGAVVVDDAGNPQMQGPAPLMLNFGFRAADITPLGNWDTIGLRATGSVDFSVTDVFVPDDMVFSIFHPPRAVDRPNSGGMGFLLPYLHSAFAAGIGRRLLDDVAALASTPSSRGGSLAETDLFRHDYARHEAAYRGARALLTEAWANVDAALAAGEPVSRRNVTLVQLALVHVHEVIRDIAVFVFSKGGGTTLRAGALQRRVRDALAGCQHMIVQPSRYTGIAHELIGAPENLVWSPVGLVPGR